MKRSLLPLFALMFLGAALLFWLGYYWLGLPESDAAHLVWSAAVALVGLAGAAWLAGTSLASFEAGSSAEIGSAARLALRHLAPLCVLGVTALLVYGLLSYLESLLGHPAFQVASFFTLTLRKPVKPESVLAVFKGVFSIVRWALLPALLWAAAASAAVRGWSGLRAFPSRRPLRPVYLLQVLVLTLIAFWLPFKLLAWIPQFKLFSVQLLSLAVRFTAGYLLCIAATLALARIASGGKPAESQPTTVPSP